MAMTDNKQVISALTERLKMLPKTEERLVLEICEALYELYYEEIHRVLAPKEDKKSEEQIREYIKHIIQNELPISKKKREKFATLLPKYKKAGNKANEDKCYMYFARWDALYDNFYALTAFRYLENFAMYLELDKPEDGEHGKIWEYSIDPFHDNGWSGCTKGFWYYANKMVYDDSIKFIMKQMPTSFGKCIKADTPIMTPTGTKPIKDINVGDFVYSMKDNELCERRVLNKWDTKKKQITITTRGGVSITVSPEHKLYTQRGYVQAQDIKQSDYLYRLCKKYEPKNPIQINDDELTFVSCMLFDGHCKEEKYKFCKMPDTKITRAFLCACDNLGIKHSSYQKNGTECIEYRVWQNGKIANEIMQRYGIEGKLSKEKRLPKQFFEMSLKQKYDFLGLMFATDGYISKRGDTGITTASKGLARDIMELLDTCGIYSCMSYKKSKCNGKFYDAWRITIPNEYLKPIYENCYCYDKQESLEILYFKYDETHCNNTNYPKELFVDMKDFRRIVRKQWSRNNTFKRSLVESFNSAYGTLNDIVYKDFVWEQIKSIEYDDTKVDMVDIEVEDTHNFIANHIVSHNSYSDSVLIAFLYGNNPKLQILKVVGNKSLSKKCTQQIIDIMTHQDTRRRFLKVFPQFLEGLDNETQKLIMADKYDLEKMDTNQKASMKLATTRLKSHIFSICTPNDGLLTLAMSGRDTSFECITKDMDRDGIACTWLFLDDVVQRSEIMKIAQHNADIRAFDGTWKKRCRDENKLKIVVGGTTYDPYDLLVTLKARYSNGKVKRSPINKYTTLSLDESAVFVCVPKLDENDQLTFPQKTVLESVLQDRKNDYDLFMAMDMQQPVAPKDNPFYWDSLRLYSKIPEEKRSPYCWATLDLSRRGFDNASMPIFVEVDGDYYLKDAIYEQDVPEKVYDMVVAKVRQHYITKLLVENNIETSAKAILEERLANAGLSYCEVIETFTAVNKDERIYNMSGKIRTNCVFPAQGLYSSYSPVGRFMLDIVGYNYANKNKNKHDDSIDSVAMFCDNLIGGGGVRYATVGTFRR